MKASNRNILAFFMQIFPKNINREGTVDYNIFKVGECHETRKI